MQNLLVAVCGRWRWGGGRGREDHRNHHWKVKVKVTQSCPTLCDRMDFAAHGILQARILEWVAIPFPRGSFQSRDQTQVTEIWDKSFREHVSAFLDPFNCSMEKCVCLSKCHLKPHLTTDIMNLGENRKQRKSEHKPPPWIRRSKPGSSKPTSSSSVAQSSHPWCWH